MLRIVTGSALCAFFVVALPRAAEAQSVKARITQIEIASPELAEVEITSDQEFPVLDSLVTLHIGNKSYTISRSPENGSLNILIFTVPARELKSGMSNSSDAWVDYGQANGLRWDLGKLSATASGSNQGERK